jgi:uncharacterized coiled-coil DUF342 family protein
MAVMVREAWTDERLDDLSRRVDKGFERLDEDIREVRGEIRDLRAEMKAGFERVDDEFREFRAEMNARLDSMQRTMIIGFVTLFASIVASVIGAAVVA